MTSAQTAVLAALTPAESVRLDRAAMLRLELDDSKASPLTSISTSDGSGQRLTGQILGSLDRNEDGIALFSGSPFFSASIRRFQISS